MLSSCLLSLARSGAGPYAMLLRLLCRRSSQPHTHTHARAQSWQCGRGVTRPALGRRPKCFNNRLLFALSRGC